MEKGLDEATQVIRDAWIEAASLFVHTTHDDAKRAFYTRHIGRFDSPHRSVAALLDKARELSQSKNEGRSTFRKRLGHIIQTINNHAVVGDVFFQSQGLPASIPWGAFRLLLRLGAADLDACQHLAGNVVDINHQIACAETRLNLYPTNVGLFDAVARLFASILRYLVQAEFYMKTKKPFRAAKAAAGGTDKLRQIIGDIQHNELDVDRAFHNASIGANFRFRRISQLQTFLNCYTADPQLQVEPVRPLPAAFRWLANSDELKSWQANDFDGIFHVEGPEGSGKTQLADHFLRTAETLFGAKLTISYSFHDRPRSASYVVFILVTLLTIATNSSPTMRWHDMVVGEALQLTDFIACRPQHALELVPKILEDIFLKDELPTFAIIIDALNECDEHDSAQLFGHLHRISQSPKVRLVILSRKGLRIKSTTRLVMDRSRIEEDIKTYVMARLADSERLRCVRSELLDALPQLSLGMFLSVKLVLDNLEQAHTPEEQKQILDQAPEDLDAMYEQIWSKEEPSWIPRQALRLEILAMLVATRGSFSVDGISYLVALDIETNNTQPGRKLHDPVRTVQELCGSFVSLHGRKVEIAHPSMKEFLKRKLVGMHRDPDAYLAEKCLSVLSQKPFASIPYAAALLRKHLLPPGMITGATAAEDVEDPVPYEYAALHWWEHVTAVLSPSESLLSKMYAFITGISAVTWSERLADIKGGQAATTLNVQIDVRTALTAWLHGLPPAKREKVPLRDYFVVAHDLVRRKLTEDDQDHLLPYLPAIRCGQWFNIAGQSAEDFKKAYDYKKIVVTGFTRVLGKRNPLTLTARTEWAKDFFFLGLIKEAEAELLEIVQIEKDISGGTSDTYFKALQLLGTAQYSLTKFDQALASLEESGTGLLNLFGTEQWICQVNDLYAGWVLERRGNLDEALKKYESIVRHWIPIAGENNGLSIMAITSIGSVKRKQRQYEEAKPQLLSSWRLRLRQFLLSSNTTVDSGLQLALMYREDGAYDDASNILQQVKKSTVLETDAERRSQAAHIGEMIAFEQGELERPKNVLIEIIDGTVGAKRNENNRECLWIRITLADVLRHHGDDAEALMLFAELVRPSQSTSGERPGSPTLEDEPEPPSRLRIAEKALRLVKDRDQSGAADLLKENGLEWVRPEDFWIRQGGPPTDTAWMKPVSFSKLLSCSVI